MATIIDKRFVDDDSQDSNRKKFIKRYKDSIKDQVKQKGITKSLKGFTKDGAQIRVKGTKEPSFRYNSKSGNRDYILPRNDRFSKGDLLPKPSSQDGQGPGKSGDGEDDFTFTLTIDEFLDLFFDDMELPNYVKESMKASLKEKRRRAGYTKRSIPPRLNLKKTFEQALARKISMKTTEKKPRYLDEEDLRYNHYITEKKPSRKAVMFCIMDVSGSMTENLKLMAKKFFLLLYLFLYKTYDDVEIVYIRHTDTAEVVDEKEFFYATKTGWTLISPAFELVHDLIKKQYSEQDYNIFIAQASDGDNGTIEDTDTLIATLENDLLPIVQYMAYLQVEDQTTLMYRSLGGQFMMENLWMIYSPLSQKYPQFNMAKALEESQIFPVLKELFRKGK